MRLKFVSVLTDRNVRNILSKLFSGYSSMVLLSYDFYHFAHLKNLVGIINLKKPMLFSNTLNLVHCLLNVLHNF